MTLPSGPTSLSEMEMEILPDMLYQVSLLGLGATVGRTTLIGRGPVGFDLAQNQYEHALKRS